MRELSSIRAPGDSSHDDATGDGDPAAESCDVAVVGGGPAGAATATWLARAGCRVVLIERSRYEQPRPGESLAPGLQPLLHALGAWDDFLALSPLPSHGTRSAWGESTPRSHAHLVRPFQNGWHVDRARFDAMLAGHARGAGVALRTGWRVTGCTPLPAGRVRLRCVSGDVHAARERSVEAAFVVDATGRASALTRAFGARHAVFDRLVGVGMQFACDEAAQQCFTQVETVRDGWWYSAPLPQGALVALWMTDADIARADGPGAASAWREAFARATLTSRRIGAGAAQGAPRLFPSMSLRHLRAPDVDRPYLCVGDAALAVDPITGSGVVRALRTAREGAAAVRCWLAGERDALARYEAARDAECTAYLHERAAFYGEESRWPDATFWRRRSAAVAAHRRDLAALAG
jgi:2-polyprenyl-6-methoxyphenol hydroxylase-like FAD-dependent oxidoreductase